MASCYARGCTQSELRQSTAICWRHSGQRYTYQHEKCRELFDRKKSKSRDHSLVSSDALRKTNLYKKVRANIVLQQRLQPETKTRTLAGR